MIDQAMVLAAGLGTRFRAVSGDLPKPLVPVAGKPLIDWTLDMLATGGVAHAVVNVHYKADLIEDHLSLRTNPEISISDERDERLETGGGLMKATPLFAPGPIFCTNTDAIIVSEGDVEMTRMAAAWDDQKMDALLLLVAMEDTSGYVGKGDFVLEADGRLSWEGEGPRYVFTGLQLIHPRLWAGEPVTPQSTKVFWDRAMVQGRAYGLVHHGRWMHVGDPEGFAAAEDYLKGA